MPANRPKRPDPRPRITPTAATDAGLGRAVAELAQQAERQANRIRPRAVVTRSLVVGDNEIVHGLGLTPVGYVLMPTVADATFAHALKSKSATSIVVTVVGVAQPNAVLEVFA